MKPFTATAEFNPTQSISPWNNLIPLPQSRDQLFFALEGILVSLKSLKVVVYRVGALDYALDTHVFNTVIYMHNIYTFTPNSSIRVT
jgi:hypothetical protein